MKTILFVLLVVAGVLCHEFDSSVMQLDTTTFDQYLGTEDGKSNPSQSTIVMMYAPWCGHCKKMIPTWNNLAKQAPEDKYRVAAIDCSAHREVGTRFGVKGFPSLFLIHKNGQVYKYKGARQLDSLQQFASKNYESYAEHFDFPHANAEAKVAGESGSFLDSIGTLPVIVGGGLLIVLIGLFTVNLGGGDKKPEEKQVSSPRSREQKKRE